MFIVQAIHTGEYLAKPGFAPWERVQFAPARSLAFQFPTRADAVAWCERHRPIGVGGWEYSLRVVPWIEMSATVAEDPTR